MMDVEGQTIVWDDTALSEMFDGKEEYIREAVHIFVENTPLRMEALKQHVAAKDTGKIVLEAHSIKGSAAAVGGCALRSVAFELEKAARAGDMEQIKVLMPQLVKRFVELKNTMQHLF